MRFTPAAPGLWRNKTPFANRVFTFVEERNRFLADYKNYITYSVCKIVFVLSLVKSWHSYQVNTTSPCSYSCNSLNHPSSAPAMLTSLLLLTTLVRSELKLNCWWERENIARNTHLWTAGSFRLLYALIWFIAVQCGGKTVRNNPSMDHFDQLGSNLLSSQV